MEEKVKFTENVSVGQLLTSTEAVNRALTVQSCFWANLLLALVPRVQAQMLHPLLLSLGCVALLHFRGRRNSSGNFFFVPPHFMKLFEDLVAALLDPSEDADRFVAHCNAWLRKALRISHLSSNEQSFPPEAVALCICSHLCEISIEAIYRAYTSVLKGHRSSSPPLSQEILSFVWESGWKPVVKMLGPGRPGATGTVMRTRQLFHDFNILFVPSLLFSEKCARLLLNRIQEKGGKGKVCSSGQKGFKQAQHELQGEEALTPRNIVCADINLINKYSTVYKLEARPPKWVRECLRDLRIKDADLFLRKEKDQEEKTGTSTSTPQTKRKTREFRAEVIIGSMHSSSKRGKWDTSRRTEEGFGASSAKSDGAVPDFVSPVQIGDDCVGNWVVTPTKVSSTKKPGSSNWACEVRTCFSKGDFPMNEKICELLGVIQESCQAKKEGFRAIGYQRAIARISALSHEVTTVDDVRELSSGKGIGERMERKVMEIITTGRLLQAEAVLENCDNVAVRQLCNVWGIGPVKAMNLVAHGIKSVEELRRVVRNNPRILDTNQTIGLRHYEDLLLRIPREHVAELENFVRMVVKSIDQGLDVTVAGSYLRGKKDCGDVDVMVYGPQEKLKIAFPKVKDIMKRKGVLTDDLIDGEFKYFGIFRFPGRPHGRIDLFAVPEQEYPFALLTYTGSAIFNRSMRAKARALGYSLSHKGIQRVNRYRQSKTRVEPPIRVKDEREIFLLLDIPYVAPSARSI